MNTLSLIVPCYNEAKSLPLLLDRCARVITRDDIEVILVDNGSIDGSEKILSDISSEYSFARGIRINVNQGYGHGILSGLRAANGRFLAWTHADMQTDPVDVLKGLEIFEHDREPDRLFVKGQRQGRPFGDAFFTAGMGIFESLLLRYPLWDINAQPTMFARPFFEAWANPPIDFSLDLYAFYQARRKQLRVERFPVHFRERVYGTSHWNVDWRAKIKFIKQISDYSFRLRRELKEDR